MLAAGCATDEDAPTTSAPDSTASPNLVAGTGRVTRIHDGDTIEVERPDGTIDVRLLAVNAPDQGECYADPPLDHLISTLMDQQVRLEFSGQDQFGRTLAHVFEADRHVNRDLVGLGFALANTPQSEDPYGPAILEAEESAFLTGTGLWSAGACGSATPPPDVDIDDLVYDPQGPDDENLSEETIGIVNQDDEPIDLTGWIIRDESTRHRFTFGPGLTLDPGETLTISSDDPGWDPGDSPVWNNDGDMALLQLPDGTIIDRWRY